MSEPRVICEPCGRVRSCYDHLRAEFPPDAARRWMAKTCPLDGEGCDVQYRAGVLLSGPYVGQSTDATTPQEDTDMKEDR